MTVCFVFAFVCGYLGSEISSHTHRPQTYVHGVAMCGGGKFIYLFNILR